MIAQVPSQRELSDAEIVDKIGRWMRQPEAQLFMERVEQKSKYALQGLKTAVDMHNVGRSQGQLDVLDWILRLRREEED